MGNHSVHAGSGTRVFAVSDLHVHHKTNREYLEGLLKDEEFSEGDVLIVAGDVATELALVKEALVFLKKLFPTVCYCPGNNELRLSKADKKQSSTGFRHSVEKFEYIMTMCDEIGVHVRPVRVKDVWIVPLFSWYTPEFDSHWKKGDFEYTKGWLDFRACKWPEELDGVGKAAAHFLSLNEGAVHRNYDAPVISFSHFLPRFELLPSRNLLAKKSLPLVVGDHQLDKQIRRIGSKVHVFGHTHINADKTIKGVRYIQNAFGHPAERKQLWKIFNTPFAPKLVYTTASRERSSSSGSESEIKQPKIEKKNKPLEKEKEELKKKRKERKDKEDPSQSGNDGSESGTSSDKGTDESSEEKKIQQQGDGHYSEKLEEREVSE